MNRELVGRSLVSLLYFVIFFVAAVLIALRFLAWLYFASTLPLWVLVPIFSILGLLGLLIRAVRPSLAVVMLLFGAYLLSVIFFGWDSMMSRHQVHHQPITFDLVEAVLIIILTSHCVILALRR